MSTPSSSFHQPNPFDADLVALQPDPADPSLRLALEIPGHEFGDALFMHYTQSTGAPGRPIRLMVDFDSQTDENSSGEAVVLQWKCNSYYQAFCGMKEFQRSADSRI